MSISSMANVAFVRRADVDVPEVAPAAAAPNSLNKIERATGGTDDSQSAVTTALKVIATYIPTEVLTLYVAVIAALRSPAVAAAGPASNIDFHPLWRAFYCFLVATPIVVWVVYATKCKAANKPIPFSPRAWPLWEMLAATVGYAAWAFAMPQSPFQQQDWYSAALAGITVMIVSAVLGLLAPLFTRPLAS
jgi:hypothetical protein